MQAASLRNADQVRETAGRFRGHKALDCPNCGGSISFVAAGHPGRVPVLRFDRGLRRRGRGHREAQAQVHQDHAGAGRDGQHGADYSLIGLMKCADPDPEEPSQWIEYLMFNPAQGFLWLVETDEGWERVKVCDTWPSLVNASTVRWQSRQYRKLYDYTSRVDLALGAFNWRVKVGDSTQITDYQTGNFKLTREQGEAELGWSASSPVSGAIGRMVQAAGAGGAEVVGRRGASPAPTPAGPGSRPSSWLS